MGNSSSSGAGTVLDKDASQMKRFMLSKVKATIKISFGISAWGPLNLKVHACS
jgi:hypothetical protein